MPYKIFPIDGGYSVYTVDAQGGQSGSPHNANPYAARKDAVLLLRSLYAAAEKQGETIGEFDVTLLSPDGAGFNPVFPQADVGYVEQSTRPDQRCGSCVFFASGNFCYLVANYPLLINADGWCDKYQEVEILADPAGVHEMPETTAIPESPVEVKERAALNDLVISEYKGAVPDVPDAPGVDKPALTAGDKNPTFVIRPIAQVGRTSKNGILYDQALIDSIREQINANHPMGIFGHIKEADRATAHPAAQAYWIGAKQYGDKLYAKAYIADPERAADIRRKKALNSADGTSIYGLGDKIAGSNGASLLRNFVLESLDFAPVDRASLDMGREMYITSEMLAEQAQTADTLLLNGMSSETEPDPQDPHESEENEMASDVIDPMVGLTANWQSMQPDALCEQIMQMVGAEKMGKVAEAMLAKNKMKAVAMEMETVPSATIAEMTAQRDVIAELRDFREKAIEREFNTALGAAIVSVTDYRAAGDAAKEQALKETRTILEMSVRAALGESKEPEKIAEAVKATVTAMPTVLEMLRDKFTGGKTHLIGQDNHRPAENGYYNGAPVDDPKFQTAARARMSV